MIPTIGIMIGLYILTRMVELTGTSPKTYVRILAAVTAVGSIAGMASLLFASGSLSDLGGRALSYGRPALPSSGTGLHHDSTVSPVPGSVGTAPEWDLTQSKNPLDDSPTVVLSLSATSGTSRLGESPDLMLRCKQKRTEVFINWHSFMGSDGVEVTTRVGHAPASTADWNLSTDKTATFYEGNAVAFIKSLTSVDTLVAGTTPYGESPVIAVFSVTGLSSKLAALQGACGWK